MKAFPELVTMVKGLCRSLRAVSSSMILILLLVYVWAIMMHMLMKEEKEFNDALYTEEGLGFQSIITCIWTLLVDATLLLDDAGPLMTTLLFSDKPNFVTAGLLFLFYYILSAMLILQSLIGVLCDVVSQVRAEEQDAHVIGLVKQEILSDLRKYEGGSNVISQEELLSVLQKPPTIALMKKLKIDRVYFWEVQKCLFTKPGQTVPIKACLDLMVTCQGNNPTTVEAMAGGMLSVIHELAEVRKILENDMAKMESGLTSTITDLVQGMARPCSQGEFAAPGDNEVRLKLYNL